LPIDKGNDLSSSNHNFVRNCSNLFLVDLASYHFFLFTIYENNSPIEKNWPNYESLDRSKHSGHWVERWITGKSYSKSYAKAGNIYKNLTFIRRRREPHVLAVRNSAVED